MITIEDINRMADEGDRQNDYEWEMAHPATYVDCAIERLDWALKCMRTSPWQLALHGAASDAVMTALDLLHRVKK